MQLSARHRPGDNRAFGAPIIKEITWLVRKIFLLYVRVEPAASQQHGNSAEANEFAQANEHRAHACVGREDVAIKIKLQFQRLPEVAKFSKTPRSSPRRISCHVLSPPGKSDLWKQARI